MSAGAEDPGTGPSTADMMRLLRDEPGHWAHVPEVPGCRGLVELARGGQGAVYSALREADARRVAVKVLHPRFVEDQAGRRRFEREATLAATLEHPGIVRVLGHGLAADGRPYIVMELAEGRPLSSVARDPEVDRTRRLAIFQRLCDAVAHAHRRGVMHRDLKPANVLVRDRDDHVTVLDFGLARPEVAAESVARVSATGEFVGSIPWAAPEQLGGRPESADVRTDVHALGAILYLLLTGVAPFDAEAGLGALVASITRGAPPDPRRVADGLDPDLASIVRRAMAKDPEDRYESAGVLAEDVGRAMDGEPVADRARSTWRRTQRSLVRARRLLVACAAVALALASITAFAVRQTRLAVAAQDRADASLQRERLAAREALATLEAFEEALGSIDPSMAGSREPTLADALEAVTRRIDDDAARGLGTAPRGHLAERLASIRFSRGEYAEAAAAARTALRALGRTGALEARAGAHETLGMALHALDDPAAAVSELETSARLFRQLARTPEGVRLAAHWRERAQYAEVSAATAEAAAGRVSEAEARLLAIVAAGDRWAEAGRPGEAWILATFRLGEVLNHRGRYAEAAGRLETAIAAGDEYYGAARLPLSGILRSAGRNAMDLGRLDEARGHLDAAIAILRPTFPDGHPQLALTLALRGRALAMDGDPERGLAECDGALGMLERILPGPSRHRDELERHRRAILAMVGREPAAGPDAGG